MEMQENFNIFQNRLDSFNKFYINILKIKNGKLRAKMLAFGGLYYTTGKSDVCKCIACYEIFSHIDPDKDILLAHAKRSGERCLFLSTVAFVTDMSVSAGISRLEKYP